ncbi:hypothetical protein D3C80_1518530 [compost metagenome]
MHLQQIELLPRVADARLCIGSLGGGAGCAHGATVPAVGGAFHSRTDRQLDGLDGDHVLLAKRPGDFRSGDDRSRRAVADTTAIEKAQWVCDHRGIENLLHADSFSNMRLGAEHTVLVALPGDMCQCSFEVFFRRPVFGAVAGCQLCKPGRSGAKRQPEVVERTFVGWR